MISEKFWNTGIRVAPWCSGYHYCTTSFFHSTKPELWFCTSSYRGVSEIRNCKDLWQWSWLEIKLNAFHRLTILQKQFIIIFIKQDFVGEFVQKYPNCLFKMKLGICTNSIMLNSMVMFTFYVLDRKYTFWAYLVHKIKIVCLR